MECCQHVRTGRRGGVADITGIAVDLIGLQWVFSCSFLHLLLTFLKGWCNLILLEEWYKLGSWGTKRPFPSEAMKTHSALQSLAIWPRETLFHEVLKGPRRVDGVIPLEGKWRADFGTEEIQSPFFQNGGTIQKEIVRRWYYSICFEKWSKIIKNSKSNIKPTFYWAPLLCFHGPLRPEPGRFWWNPYGSSVPKMLWVNRPCS